MNLPEQVAAADWETWVASHDAVVLDVREPREWELGTLPGATLMSQGDVVSRMDELDKSHPILVACRSGSRSTNVANFLAFNGFTVANMEGGYMALGMQE